MTEFEAVMAAAFDDCYVLGDRTEVHVYPTVPTRSGDLCRCGQETFEELDE